jgi:hypothetical protein
MTVEATLPNRWALAAGRSSSKGCVICRGPRLPGARLCGPCKAALKRARLETVSELIPHPSRVAAEAQEARRRAREVAAVRAAKPRRRWLIVPVYFLAAAAVIGAGYLGWHVARPAHEAPAAALPPPAPRAASQATVPNAPAEPVAGAVTSQAKGVPEASTPRPAPRATVVSHAARIAPKRVVEAPPVPPAPPADRFAVAAPREVPAAVPMPEAVLPVREAPAPDRWQVMSDQIVRCGRDGFLAGVICEQRVRLKYCEGYWGSAPQCPSGITNDHGN